MAEARIDVLGPVRVSVAGKPVPTGGARINAIAATLVAAGGRLVERDILLGVLWPGEQPSGAINQLQVYVGRLRRALEPGRAPRTSSAVVGGPSGYRIDPDRIDSDLFDLRTAVRSGSGEALVTVLRRGRGPIAEDVSAALSDVAVIEQAIVEYRAALTAAAGTVGPGPAAEDLLLRFAAEAAADPWDEALHAGYLRLLATTGRRGKALQVYDDIRGRLREELGADPSPSLRAAFTAVLREDDPSETAAPRPRQLLADLRTLVGRDAELAAIEAAIAADRDAATPCVVAVSGPGGVGKSSLVTHVAHRHADDYPDGQIVVSLDGTHLDPRSSADVLSSMLLSLGQPPERIPVSTPDRAALFRSLTSDKRLLLVLDDARDAEQVEPLLPNHPGSLVLITSRRTLSDLAPARSLLLDVLTSDDAAQLLMQVAGRDFDPDPAALERIVAACDRLPLAVMVAGARLASRPQWTLRDLAERLSDETARLQELRYGHLNVQSSIALSYTNLSAEARRAFRLLSLLPGRFYDDDAAAALDVAVPTVVPMLDELVDVGVLAAPTATTYRFHDLIRLGSAAYRDTEDAPATVQAAVDRIVDHAADLFVENRAAQDRVSGSDHSIFYQTSPRLPAAVDMVTRLVARDPPPDARAVERVISETRNHRWFVRTGDGVIRLAELCLQRYSATDQPSLRVGALTVTGLSKTAPREALGYFSEAVALGANLADPRPYFSALGNLHTTYRELGDLQVAADQLDRLVAATDAFPEPERTARRAILVRSRILLDVQAGQFDEVESAVEPYVRSEHPQEAAFGCRMRAACSQLRGDFDTADEWVARALTYADHLGATHLADLAHLRARNALGRGDYRGARSELETLIAADPDHLRRDSETKLIWIDLGLAQAGAGDDPLPVLTRGLALLEQDDHPRAAEARVLRSRFVGDDEIGAAQLADVVLGWLTAGQAAPQRADGTADERSFERTARGA